MRLNEFFPSYPDVLSPEEVMEILRTGRNTIYAMLMDGELQSIRIAGKYRVPKMYLINYIYPGNHFFDGTEELDDTDMDAPDADDNNQMKGH